MAEGREIARNRHTLGGDGKTRILKALWLFKNLFLASFFLDKYPVDLEYLLGRDINVWKQYINIRQLTMRSYLYISYVGYVGESSLSYCPVTRGKQ